MSQTNFDEKHFFDKFPEFYKTSETGSSPNRLNHRYLALIHSNKEIINNSSILDLASHDGRWSFAALQNGAKKVCGIEGRKELVQKSLKNMEKFEISQEKYSFIVGDIFEEIKKFKNNEFDIVFCLGIFYHIMDHMLLLNEIKQLNPKYIIMDTNVSTLKEPMISLREENSIKEANAISSGEDGKILVGHPSKKALELMLSHIGFDFTYYDWENSGIINWENIEDYNFKKGVSMKKAIKYGSSMMRNLKGKHKTLTEDIAFFRSSKRVTLLAKNMQYKTEN